MGKSSRPQSNSWTTISISEQKLSYNKRSLILMAPSRSTRSFSWLFSMFIFGLLLSPVEALYFYMDGTTQKCFYEELPKDTLVVGAIPNHKFIS
jgi:hypothetical protein